MQTFHQQIDVPFRYPVAFTEGLFRPGHPLLREVIAAEAHATSKKVLAVLDAGVVGAHPALSGQVEAYAAQHADVMHLVAPPLVVPGGEAVKNDGATVHRIHEAVHRYAIDRHAYVLAVGGGAVLDAVGYAAATAHRGIRLIRVPTTVLAQNDAGLGVKNGINAFGKKNFLGTFAPPYAVLNDARFLTTLSDRDWRAGITEAVKVALLKDPGFFDEIEAQAGALVARDLAAMQGVVVRCARLHLDHIATSGDPFEMGSSRPLDFGHWAAHKLEQQTGYALRHGEAVGIGIALDVTYSCLGGWLRSSEWGRIIHMFLDLKLPVYHDALSHGLEAPSDQACVLSGLDEFREHLGGELTIMLLAGIGQGFEVHEVDLRRMKESIRLLERLPSRPVPTQNDLSTWIDTTIRAPSHSNS